VIISPNMKLPRHIRRVFLHSLPACCMWVLCAGCMSGAMQPRDAGPLYSAATDVHDVPGTQVMGPLVETRKDQDGHSFSAVRPFWSRVGNDDETRVVNDILWPIGMIKQRGIERDWRIFPALGHDFDVSDPLSRHRWSVFPLLYGGRSRHGQPYFAFFPFGGTLYEFLGRDRIVFVLFPIYAYTEQSDNQTHSVLWPIFSRTKGDDVYRLRIWPFYGIAVNQGRWTKRFVLWPLWTSVKYTYPDQMGGGFVFFPFYGYANLAERHTRLLLPPLFKWEWTDQGEHLAVNAPWPFVQYRRGLVDKLYIWPLGGYKHSGAEKQWFALWPIISGSRIESVATSIHRFRALPFIHYESTYAVSNRPAGDVEGQTETAATSRYFKLWPLVSYRREAQSALCRVLDLWPLKHTPAVERNWAPIWSLYTFEREGERRHTELLWGLFRHHRAEKFRRWSVFPLLQREIDAEHQRQSWSILYGLAGVNQEGLQKTYRLLYVLKFTRQL